MSDSYLVVELNRQPVELCKLLKIANLVSGGGEAKVVISEGYVLLNGEVEYQKRKKVYHEDVVEFNGEVIQLIINEKLSETQSEFSNDADGEIVNTSADNYQEYIGQTASYTHEKTIDKPSKAKVNNPSNAKKKSTNQAKQHKADFKPFEAESEQTVQPRKRRPISF